MKKQLTVMVLGFLVAGTVTANAADGFPFLSAASQPTLLPAPAYQEPAVPPAPAAEGTTPDTAYMPVPEAQPIQLYQCVKYKDLDEMAPCAVPKIIAVQDPCPNPCSCCGPQCVYIQICVPACGCEQVSSRKHGTRVRYDYGKYAVDVRVKNGYIEVDYQD